MPFKTEDNGSGVRVILKDDVTIDEASGLKDVLLEVIQKEKNIVLDFDQATDIDTSILQLIVSTLEAAKELQTEISFSGMGEVFENALERIGLNLNRLPRK